jgi:hypothetical protein
MTAEHAAPSQEPRLRTLSPALLLLALGALSGVVSALMSLKESSITLFDTPLAQGLIFGGTLTLGCLLWGGARWKSLLVVPFTTAGWIASVRLFGSILDAVGEYAAGAAAGALGSAITALGVATACPALRRTQPLLVTTAAGTVAGLLVRPAESLSEDLMLLFVVWQAAVAASIGAVLAGSRREGADGH